MLKRVVHNSEYGKLNTNLKDRYAINKIASKDAYFLSTMEGKWLTLPRNAIHMNLFNKFVDITLHINEI